MTLLELIGVLDARDVHLAIRLVVDAPRGSIDDPIRAALFDHRAGLLERLAQPLIASKDVRPNQDLAPEPPRTDDAIPDRAVWRAVLATWSDAERERWGLRTAALEDQGLAWNVAEWRAFLEIVESSESEVETSVPCALGLQPCLDHQETHRDS